MLIKKPFNDQRNINSMLLWIFEEDVLLSWSIHPRPFLLQIVIAGKATVINNKLPASQTAQWVTVQLYD